MLQVRGWSRKVETGQCAAATGIQAANGVGRPEKVHAPVWGRRHSYSGECCVTLRVAGRTEPAAGADSTAHGEVAQRADMVSVAVPVSAGARGSSGELVDPAPVADCTDDENTGADDRLRAAAVDTAEMAADNFVGMGSVAGAGSDAAGTGGCWTQVERRAQAGILAAAGRPAAGIYLTRIGSVGGRVAAPPAVAHALRAEVGRSRHYHHQGLATVGSPWCCAVSHAAVVPQAAVGQISKNPGQGPEEAACCARLVDTRCLQDEPMRGGQGERWLDGSPRVRLAHLPVC
jgi:hypothetical protein